MGICLLVGHGKGNSGSYDPGATCKTYHEFKIAREIAKHAAAYYMEKYNESCSLINYSGNLNLAERIKEVNKNNFDFVAEIHLNAGGGTGSEVYYSKGNKAGQAIAKEISSSIAFTLEIKDRGAKTKLNAQGKDYFGIIRQTKPTAVLIETVFIDSSDLDKVKGVSGQRACGIAIAQAIAKARGIKEKTKSSSIAIGDKVSLQIEATYYDGKPIPYWVYSFPLYVRDIKEDRVVISTAPSGAVTGAVKMEYLKKI